MNAARALVLLVLLVAGCAGTVGSGRVLLHSTQVGRTGGWLYDEPCTVQEVRAMVSPVLFARLRNAEFDFLVNNSAEVRRFKGCWIEEGGVMHILFEDGDLLRVPRSTFDASGRPRGARDA